jgi:hypothetical protein
MRLPEMFDGRRWIGGSGGAIVAFVLLCIPRRRRLWRWIPLALLAFPLLGVLSACGGGGGSGSSVPPNPGTTPGNYTLTVTGTGDDSGKTTASTTFTVTVQ